VSAFGRLIIGIGIDQRRRLRCHHLFRIAMDDCALQTIGGDSGPSTLGRSALFIGRKAGGSKRIGKPSAFETAKRPGSRRSGKPIIRQSPNYAHPRAGLQTADQVLRQERRRDRSGMSAHKQTGRISGERED